MSILAAAPANRLHTKARTSVRRPSDRVERRADAKLPSFPLLGSLTGRGIAAGSRLYIQVITQPHGNVPDGDLNEAARATDATRA